MHFSRFYSTSHGVVRKAALTVQFLFMMAQSILAWFAVANLFLSYMLIFNQAINFAPFAEKEMKLVFIFGYTTLIFFQLLIGTSVCVCGWVGALHDYLRGTTSHRQTCYICLAAVVM
jgi:hypothetical protein